MRDTNPGVVWTPQPLADSDFERLLALIFGEPTPAAGGVG